MNTLETLVLATVFCGFFGIIFKRNLILKILSMDVMSTGVIAYYVLIASRKGLVTPIATPETALEGVAYADPVPQAVILTAIVIGFSIQALMLVGVMKLSNIHPTLDCQDIENSYRESKQPAESQGKAPYSANQPSAENLTGHFRQEAGYDY